MTRFFRKLKEFRRKNFPTQKERVDDIMDLVRKHCNKQIIK